MSVEKLGDFLSESYNKGFLSKIFLGQQFEQAIKKSFGEEVKIVLKGNEIHLICSNPSQARFFSLKKRALYTMIGKTFGDESKKMTLKVRVRTA